MSIGEEDEARRELERSRGDIERFFAPKRGVAIAGSVDAGSPALLRKRLGEHIKVCFVNPKGGMAGEVPVYRSALELPDDYDVIVIRVGPERVAQVVEDCGKRGLKNVIIFSSGFAEVGPQGRELERRVAETARRSGVRIIGPNTNDNTFEQFPIPANHRGGLVALITQSGYNGRPVVEGTSLGMAFRRWVTAGNEVDLEVADFIDYFAHDAQTAAIACYVEGFKSAAKLRVALAAANELGKPVVMLKMGSTEGGAKAAASHTGHLAGSDAVINGLFRQYGVTRVEELNDLQQTANLFAKLPAGTGPRCALYTMSGGSAALMAELAEKCGVPAPAFASEAQEALYRYIPRYLSVANPIDNGGQFSMFAPQKDRLAVFDLLAANPEVDVIVVGLSAATTLAENMCADVLAWAPTAPKPVVAVWGSVIADTPAYADLVKSGVPIFRSYRGCFTALKAFSDYQKHRPAFRRRPASAPALTAAQRAALAKAGVLGAADALAVLKDAGVPLAGERLVDSAAAAREAAAALGFPVAMKIASADFPHKSDAGLVRLGVADAHAAQAAYEELVARAKSLNPRARVDGVLVQEQVTGGTEIIVGLSHDAHLGPSLTIGAGGIYAEILRDVAVRPLPVDEGDVREMIDGLKIAPLLAGARGAKPADKEALVRLALRVAALGLAAQGQLAELDLNPVVVRHDRVVAVDALVVAAGEA